MIRWRVLDLSAWSCAEHGHEKWVSIESDEFGYESN